ncbi:hypothetical protein [uncultured Hoeflea sp.]|uniref:hypothetical protein n=1 Tax=uncultured Hoeflea sp. TaxID=538666 RepID=UPI0030DD3202|tara:strand:+ start:1305 stop:2039 length:735 start_codon:yes stop_codon:yes gene_type:complete
MANDTHLQETKNPQELKKVGIFGYEIGGLGSVLAFILAVVGLIWQGWSFIVGPDARILPMRGVEFACSEQDGAECTESANLIVVADRMSIANYATDGYDLLVDPGKAILEFIGNDNASLRKIELDAQFYFKRTQIDYEQEPASKLFVKAGSVVDKEIGYYPRMFVAADGSISRLNFLRFIQFKKELISGIGEENISKIRIRFKPNQFGRNRKPLILTCTIVIDTKMRESSSDPKVGTFPRDCSQ